MWSKSLDFAHKIISPSTYACDLCSLTHGNFSEKKIWKKFRESISHELQFVYKDEFLKKYRDNTIAFRFPIILEKKESEFVVLMDADELSMIASIEELIQNLQARLV